MRRSPLAPSTPRLCLVLIALAAATAGCGGGVVPTPVLPASLLATPDVAHPGTTITLRPTFTAGIARIDPDVGPVQSGDSYVVGPLRADTRFVLTVTRDSGPEVVSLDVPLRYRERVTTVPASPIARANAGSALLTDGRILLVGGNSPGPVFWGNTETFRVADQRFDPVGELSTERTQSTVLPLSNGGALTVGGVINISDFFAATRVEEWDPAALAWSVRGNLACTRSRHSATLLTDGRVLLAGGVGVGPLTERDGELWVPGVGASSPANEMVTRRAAHTGTLMPDGRVLIVGGYALGSGEAIAQCEWFDPATDNFSAGPSLRTPRFYHAAIALIDGRVLVIGGEQEGIVMLADAEIFDPVAGAFEFAGTLPQPRTEVRATRLLDGRVLVAGGLILPEGATSRIEVWSPTTRAFADWPMPLPGGRTGHSLHTLPDGRVVLLGGDDGSGFPSSLCCVID